MRAEAEARLEDRSSWIEAVTAEARSIVETIRAGLAKLDGLSPGDQDAIVAALVSDLRARRPVAIAPLGVLGPPTEAIRDPRST